MRNLALGIMIGALICVAIMSYYPTPDTKVVCMSCGAEKWWMVVAEGDE